MTADRPEFVFREGERIRHTDGNGYADFVSDEDIRDHIRRCWADCGALDKSAMFAASVLALRSLEAEWHSA